MWLGQSNWALHLCCVWSPALRWQLSPSSLSVRGPRVQPSFSCFFSEHTLPWWSHPVYGFKYQLYAADSPIFSPSQASPLNLYPTTYLRAPLHVLCHLKINMSQTPVLPPSTKPVPPKDGSITVDRKCCLFPQLCAVLSALCELPPSSPNQSIRQPDVIPTV